MSSSDSVSGRRPPSRPALSRTSQRRMPERGGHRFQRVRQCLPALKEQAADHSLEDVAGSPTSTPAESEPKPNHGRVDLGRRPKRPGRQAQYALDVGHELHLDRQRAVVSAAGCRHNPIRDLALHHQRRVAKQPSLVCGVEQTKQNRRCDVVGKVADDSNGRVLALKQLREIDVKEIGLNETHVRRNTRRKRRGEVAIDFDGDDLAAHAPPAGQSARRGPDRSRGMSRRCVARRPQSDRATQAGSRKCWPNRFRARGKIESRSRIPNPGCASAPQSSSSTSVSPRQ